MCELFGVCAAQSFPVNDLLEAFFHHSYEHKHGWGLAVFRGGSVSMEKEPVKAEDSLYLRQRLSRKVEGANLFAHIRFATIGRIEYANCHPFIWDDDSGRTWTLIHNGTMFEGKKLSPFLDAQEGTTDSERILLYIVSLMNEAYAKAGEPLSDRQRFRLLDETICDLSAGNKLNMLLYDGQTMYVHTNCRDSLHLRRSPGRVIFSTKPLLSEGWEKVPMNRLLGFRSGEQIFEGTDHGHEFHEEDVDMTPLLSAFAEL
ncbi:MAG: class II glutamine amidotransferase [Firmicutes bacterium]|nr:class II glutamine amidotransferase [Bacillota bacterium]